MTFLDICAARSILSTLTIDVKLSVAVCSFVADLLECLIYLKILSKFESVIALPSLVFRVVLEIGPFCEFILSSSILESIRLYLASACKYSWRFLYLRSFSSRFWEMTWRSRWFLTYSSNNNLELSLMIFLSVWLTNSPELADISPILKLSIEFLCTRRFLEKS